MVKNLFLEFSEPSNKDFEEAWNTSLFIFDTNVFLDLYRFRETSRSEFLEVIESLKGRIWIPHHVALEFYRNRRSAISSIGNIFADLPAAIDKFQDDLNKIFNDKKLNQPHSTIDPKEFIESLSKLKNEYLGKVKELEQSQLSLENDDTVKAKIEFLFEGSVGLQNKKQVEFDALFKEADSRYANKIPPGYKDDGKKDAFFHRGITYPNKYGDYIIWKQILEHIPLSNHTCFIFVTADVKDDWFEKVAGKTIGPKTNLVNEAFDAGAEFFHIYNSKRFLEFASSRATNKVKVSKDTMSDVVAALKLRADHGPIVSTKHSRSFGIVGIFPNPNKPIEIDHFQKVIIRFSNPIDRASIHNIDVSLPRSGLYFSWEKDLNRIEFSDEDKTVTWHPDPLTIHGEFNLISEYEKEPELFEIYFGSGLEMDTVMDIHGNSLPRQTISFKFIPPIEFLL